MADVTDVFTDGSSLGNPGRGGWAYAVDGGSWACGHEPNTTNQRMELTAAARAVQALGGPLRVVSDSTYVVKCFTDKWYAGWHKRGWKNSAGKPVANRDLWEPFIEAVTERGDVSFAWVKGHAGQRMNSAADLLAVHAATTGADLVGNRFDDEVLERLEDGRAGRGASPTDGLKHEQGNRRNKQDMREVEGHVVAVLGHRPPELGGFEPNPISRSVARQLKSVLEAKQQLHPDLVVATGLGLGAETLGAEAALAAGVPYVAVLAFEGTEKRWPPAARQRFAELRRQARAEVVLGHKAPIDGEAFGKAMRRRDTWLLRNGDEAILVRRADDRTLGELQRRLTDALEDVWVIEPAG